MGKYDPLKQFLLASGREEVVLRFEDIEALIGGALPPSQKHPAWWSNNPSNNPMTRVWLDAGYRTERLNLDARQVVFHRDAAKSPSRPADILGRLRNALAGTVRVSAGVDLTDPTGETWDAEGS